MKFDSRPEALLATLARGTVIGMLLATLVSEQMAYAQLQPSSASIDDLTTEIIAKETDLLKLNSNLRLHQLPNAWAGRRWWIFNLAGVSLTATGAYINGAGRFSYLHKSRIKKAPRHLFVNAGWCRVTANAIMVAGGLLETAVLAYKDNKDKRQGINLPAMRRYADDLQNEIDTLIAKREALVNNAPAGSLERQLFDAEGLVINDVRNLAVNEFTRYYTETKGSRAFFYTSYLWAATSNAVAGAGGIVGNHAALTRSGTARSRTRLGGTGGIADIISGSMNQATPLVVRLASRVASSRAKNLLCKQLDCKEPGQLDQLHEHQEQYHQLVSGQPQLNAHGMVLKDNAFAKTTAIFDEHEKMRLGDVKSKKRRLVSQMIFFTGIGTPKLVNGIGTTVGAFKYTSNSQKRFESIGGPAIAYGAGYSVALAELLRYQILGEIRSARAKRDGTSAGQILKREIAELDQLSQTIKPNSAKSP